MDDFSILDQIIADCEEEKVNNEVLSGNKNNENFENKCSHKNIIEEGYGGNNEPHPNITREMVEYWVGSDTLRSGIIEILYELAVGEYEVEQMRKDIIDTND